MSVSSVKRARAELVSHGMIRVISRGANRYAHYELIEPTFWNGGLDEEEVMKMREELLSWRTKK